MAESNSICVMTALGVIDTKGEIATMASMATVTPEDRSNTTVTILNYFSK